jgi:hypothetical protein
MASVINFIYNNGRALEYLIFLTIVISFPTLPFSAEINIALFTLRAYSICTSFEFERVQRWQVPALLVVVRVG